MKGKADSHLCPQCTMPRQSQMRKWLIRLRQCAVTQKGLLGFARHGGAPEPGGCAGNVKVFLRGSLTPILFTWGLASRYAADRWFGLQAATVRDGD